MEEFLPDTGDMNELSIYVSSTAYNLSGTLVTRSKPGIDRLQVQLSPGRYSLIIEGTMNDVSNNIRISSVEVTSRECNVTNGIEYM